MAHDAFSLPDIVMQIQRNLGADVIMQFDHVIPDNR